MTAPDDLDLLAAELALGLLDGDERAAAEARLADPAFAARHAVWSGRAAAIAALAPPHAPPLTAWPAIERQRRGGPSAVTAPSALRRWQAATGIAAAAAIVLAVLLARTVAQPPVVVPRPVVVAPPMIAVLTAPKGDAQVAVTIDGVHGALTLTPARFDAGDRVAELWLIPAGQTPRPLGVVPSRSRGRAVAPAGTLALLAPGATLAISLEPPGGSPTGMPTGPVVLSGTVTAT